MVGFYDKYVGKYTIYTMDPIRLELPIQTQRSSYIGLGRLVVWIPIGSRIESQTTNLDWNQQPGPIYH